MIHDRGQVSPDTRKKILKIVEEVNFSPDILASILATKKTYKFSILIPEAQEDSSFWRAPLIGMQKAISEIGHFGIDVDYCFFDQFDPESFKTESEKMINSHPDGLLFAPVQYSQAIDLLSRCEENNIPFVFINSNIEELDYLSFIGQDSVQSGYLAARLMSLGFTRDSHLLVINISKHIANHRHLIKRNRGFENFFIDHPEFGVKITTFNIEDISQVSVNQNLDNAFTKCKNIYGIFVPNSRVFMVAKYLADKNIDIRLIGYDLTDENIFGLKSGIIDFLISQKPIEQGYHGIMALYNHLILKKGFKKNLYLPIDIITNENLNYYLEY